MICKKDTTSSAELMKRFNRKVRESRVPLSGGIDLTTRCNLRCSHCYVGDRVAEAGTSEPSTADVRRMIDQAVDEGCLFFLITGGEPLVRADFAEIYIHARKSGLIVTLFTNGTLVTDDIADVLADYPPRSVEVTIYGADAETHDSVTGVSGSFERTMRGIDLLQSRDIKVIFKSILMKSNERKFAAIEQLARDKGAEFRMDGMIFPMLSGDDAPVAMAVSPDSIVEHELSDQDRMQEWDNYRAHIDESSPSGDAFYDCGTGLNCFHISSAGILQPCLMVTDNGYDLMRGSFAEGWRDEIPKVRERRAEPGDQCKGCGTRSSCSFCPASFEMGGIRREEYFSHVCSVAEKRSERLSAGCGG